MKATDISKRLKPLVDTFLGELATIVQARVDAAVAEAEQAIEGALSAIVADLEAPPAAPRSSFRPTIVIDGGEGVGVPAGGALVAAHGLAPVRERDVKPENYPPGRRAREDRAAPQANGKRPVTCSKCGFVGGNARGCGTAHDTIVRDVEDDDAEDVAERDVTPPTMSKRDRFAEIEASAARRRGA